MLLLWSCLNACTILIPDQGSNPCPLQWKGGVLISRLPWKFLRFFERYGISKLRDGRNHVLMLSFTDLWAPPSQSLADYYMVCQQSFARFPKCTPIQLRVSSEIQPTAGLTRECRHGWGIWFQLFLTQTCCDWLLASALQGLHLHQQEMDFSCSSEWPVGQTNIIIISWKNPVQPDPRPYQSESAR